MNKVIVVLICFLLAITCQAGIIYVNDGANGLNDGSSWENAYKFLQDALEDANSSPKPVEIRVAQGIYRPDENTLHPDGTGDRTATFQLINGVTLKGGYAGFGQPDPNARDIRLYETILSGDLDSNDIEIEDIKLSDFIYSPSRSENSYTVVTGSGTDSTAVLDGFTITGGNSNGQYGPEGNGGGMYNHCGNPTVVNCIFRKNSTRGRDCCFPYIGAGGGGVFNLQSSPTFRNCRFEENLAYGADEFSCGGGIYDVNSQPTLIRCTFAGNTADGYDNEYYGGAIYDYNSSTTLTDCSFIDNWAHSGGALYSTQNSSATLRGCLFAGNYAYHGGGAILSSSARLNLANCTFTGNRAPYSATIDCEHWEETNYLKAVNSILWDGGYEVSARLSDVQITFSDIQGGWEGQGNINLDPCFAQPGHWDDNGTPDTDHDDFWINGDYHLLQCSPCINAGDPNYIAEPNETDLDGRPRVIGGRIDMGAYEFRAPRTLYVDDDATGANNGSSWVDAYKYLQDALAVAKSGDEIRVAQGIYKPDEDSNHPDGTGDREATFQLKNGVAIRGGYAGVGQPDPNARDIRLYETILSGDLDGSMGKLTKETFFDVMVPRYSSTTASYHVVLADRTDSSSVMDGFTITGGVANGSDFDPVMDITTYDGGGIYCRLASPTLIDCTIRGNCVVFHPGGPAPSGGGMYNQEGNPTLIRCTFELNAADDYDGDSWAAGLMNYLGTVRLTDCVFADNRTVQWGGGLANKGDATLERCRFVGNFARIYGGAIYNEEGLLTLKNCLLEQNSSTQYPGGGIINFGCCEVTNCTFVRNSNYAFVHSGEGAMVCNSIFWNDGGKEITGLYEPIEVEVAYSDVQGGWPGQGNINADPCFFEGCYRLKWGSPCIDAGDPNYVPEPNETDLDGIRRVVCSAVDMGAYEYHTVIGYSSVSWESCNHFLFEWAPYKKPSPHQLYIHNCGPGTLNWQITCDCNWLQVKPTTTGTAEGCDCNCPPVEPNACNCIPTGTNDTVSLDVNTIGLGVGTYDCNLIISDCYAVNNPQAISVRLIVKDCFPDMYTTYRDWVAMGKPDCWCGIYVRPPERLWPYQCDGDADNMSQGIELFRVFTNDFNILVANWKKLINDPTLNPCADFDHKPQGVLKFRVYTNDFNILVANWKKRDPDLPGNCPRPD